MTAEFEEYNNDIESCIRDCVEHKTRNPDLEQELLTSDDVYPNYILAYIRYIIGGKWEEIEDKLKQYILFYIEYLGFTGTYDEDVIQRILDYKNPDNFSDDKEIFALNYCRQVRRGRVPELEDIILSHKTISRAYICDIIQGDYINMLDLLNEDQIKYAIELAEAKE